MTVIAPNAYAVLPTRVRIGEHRDGHHAPTSEYAELFWLPLIGPTALWLGRRIAAVPRDREMQLPADFGAAFGVNPNGGKSGPMAKAFSRLVHFGLAHWEGDTFTLLVPWPHLRPGQRARLPEWLRAAQLEAENV